MTEREVSSERVSEELLREIIAGCEGVTPGPYRTDRHFSIGPRSDAEDQSNGMMLPILDVFGDNRANDCDHFQRLDPATVKTMAELALLALRSSVKTVGVKKLEWEEYAVGYRARKPFGSAYYVQELQFGKWDWNGLRCGSADEAKAAAQADYEQRILSAIEAPAAEGEQIDKTLLHGICDSLRAVIKEYEDMDMFHGSRAIMQGQLDALTAALKGDRP